MSYCTWNWPYTILFFIDQDSNVEIPFDVCIEDSMLEIENPVADEVEIQVTI